MIKIVDFSAHYELSSINEEINNIIKVGWRTKQIINNCGRQSKTSNFPFCILFEKELEVKNE